MDLSDVIERRYGDSPASGQAWEVPEALRAMLTRGSCREFGSQPLSDALCRSLCAAALAAPTKSDLQQRDIVLVRGERTRAKLMMLLTTEDWVPMAPNIAVFCGNHRRQRALHDFRGHSFVNDHLDAFFNATVDAAVALSAFVTAAETVGLGCCPISAVRNEAAAVSDLLGLPDHVFPVAGLAFGYPAAATPTVSLRLPLSATVHVDRYQEGDTDAILSAYDARREAVQPYRAQRYSEEFGETDSYGWSEDKARQYARPERAGFGGFIRRKGFSLT